MESAAVVYGIDWAQAEVVGETHLRNPAIVFIVSDVRVS